MPLVGVAFFEDLAVLFEGVDLLGGRRRGWFVGTGEFRSSAAFGGD
jgi:hypothetical protein